MNQPHIEMLRRQLAHRIEHNPAYSLRALARDISVDVGSLSRLLNGKQMMSLKTAISIGKRLNLNSEDFRTFVLYAVQAKLEQVMGATADEPGAGSVLDDFSNFIALRH